MAIDYGSLSLVSAMPYEPTPPILPEGSKPSRLSGHPTAWIAVTLTVLLVGCFGAVAVFVLFWAAIE